MKIHIQEIITHGGFAFGVWQLPKNRRSCFGIKPLAVFSTEKEALDFVRSIGPKPIGKKAEMFLDWFNNYLSVECFAESYGISVKRAKEILAQGKVEHERSI